MVSPASKPMIFSSDKRPDRRAVFAQRSALGGGPRSRSGYLAGQASDNSDREGYPLHMGDSLVLETQHGGCRVVRFLCRCFAFEPCRGVRAPAPIAIEEPAKPCVLRKLDRRERSFPHLQGTEQERILAEQVTAEWSYTDDEGAKYTAVNDPRMLSFYLLNSPIDAFISGGLTAEDAPRCRCSKNQNSVPCLA